MPKRFDPKLNGSAPAEPTFHAEDIQRVRRYQALARECGWKTKCAEESGRLVLMALRQTPAGRESIKAYWKEGKFLRYTAIYKRGEKGQTIPSSKILLKLIERDADRIGKGSKVSRKPKVGRPAKTDEKRKMIPWNPDAKDSEIIHHVHGRRIVWTPPEIANGFNSGIMYRDAYVYDDDDGSCRSITMTRVGGPDGKRILNFLDGTSKQMRAVAVENIWQVK